MSSVYIIIFILVIAFSIMLTGGSGSLLSGNMASPVTNTPTPDPSSPSPATTSPTATPSATASAWKIEVNLEPGCKSGKFPYKAGDLKIEGPTSGTVELSVGSKVVSSPPYSPPRENYTLELSNESGFNNSPWKITIKSSGATQKTYEGLPTGCT